MRKSKLAPMVPYVKHYNVTYGWYLFPARVDKKKSWLRKKDAPEHLNWGMTADPVRLEQNFTNPDFCETCGIGLPTGEINALFVVEIDTKQGHDVDGAASLRALEQTHGKLPVTLMARSPSGSLHYYFNHPGIKVWSSASKLGPGIDVRGDGGMVVAPPSKRMDGAYDWHNEEEIADAPNWLIALVTVSSAGTSRASTYGVSYATGDQDVALDPYAQLAREQNFEPIDVGELLEDMEYPGNVHDTEVLLTASLLASGEPVDSVIDTVLDEVRSRIEAQKLKWNWTAERAKLRDMCASWLRKKPDVLEMQETIPPWLAKKLNGALHGEASPQPSEAPPIPEPPKPQLPWPVMGNDALYGLAGEVVRLFEGNTEADSNAILIQFLNYYGNMVGRGHYYQVEGDQHHANLFSVIIGETGSGRKGVSAGRVRQLMRAVDKTHNGDWFLKRIKSGLSSGEGLIQEIRDDAATTDAQGNIIVGANRDKRILIDEREFSSVMVSIKREGNKLSAVLRDAWDSRPLNIMVKNNPATCREPHVSISAHVTPDELRRDLDNTSMANGYANRFLYALSKRPILLALGGTTDLNALEKLAQKISTQFFKAFEINKAMTMDAQTRDLWIKIYPELSETKPGLVGAITGRAESQTMRLALIYALLDNNGEIKLPHLKAALAVWKYSEDSVRVIFGESIGDAVADKIIEHLRAAGSGGYSLSEIHGLFNRNIGAGALTSALSTLQKRGLARKTITKTKGRPSERWFVI